MNEVLNIDEIAAEAHESEGEGGGLFLHFAEFEGPIDLLLMMAREQKVDLAKINVLQLAEQYLAFVSEARALRLELAADYLVMAAWLTFLKSRLLLPAPPKAEEPSAQDLTEALAFQLKRLEAMQKASLGLQDIPHENRDYVYRGMREPNIKKIEPVYYLSVYDLLKAVKVPLQRNAKTEFRLLPIKLYSIEESVERMRKMLGYVPNWSELSLFLPDDWEDAVESAEGTTMVRSAFASTFVAALELAKQGQIIVRQESAFGTIYVRPSNENNIENSNSDNDFGAE